MKITKEKVLKWVADGCDFESGLALLTTTGRHANMIRIIRGREHRYAGKLKYELIKAAGLKASELTAENIDQESESETEHKPEEAGSQEETVKTDDDKLPDEIRLIIKTHADLFNERSIMHESMASLPDDNSPEVVDQRKKLSDRIAEHSARIDKLFEAKEAYYKTGTMPNMEELMKEDASDEPETTALSEDPKELKLHKKNLQSANTKDHNMLEYQKESKGSKPNPMPQGPRRLKIELRIKARELTISKIDEKLVMLANQVQ